VIQEEVTDLDHNPRATTGEIDTDLTPLADTTTGETDLEHLNVTGVDNVTIITTTNVMTTMTVMETISTEICIATTAIEKVTYNATAGTIMLDILSVNDHQNNTTINNAQKITLLRTQTCFYQRFNKLQTKHQRLLTRL
jgi:hypothetical protein